ncbi:hypothetical protein LZ31DRAFT_352451 [Colletotrichum somersetense]|nr:hypothetical protein LZ31DRAFT_352451 [Colletotrichum somersetense]
MTRHCQQQPRGQWHFAHIACAATDTSTRPRGHAGSKDAAGQPFPEKMPEGLVPIVGGGGEGSDSGVWWIVDTNTGTVIVYDAGNKQVQDAPDDQPRLWTSPQPAEPFFNPLYNSLYSLDLEPLPRPDTEVAEYYPEFWGVIWEGREEEEDGLADRGIESCAIHSTSVI